MGTSGGRYGGREGQVCSWEGRLEDEERRWTITPGSVQDQPNSSKIRGGLWAYFFGLTCETVERRQAISCI